MVATRRSGGQSQSQTPDAKPSAVTATGHTTTPRRPSTRRKEVAAAVDGAAASILETIAEAGAAAHNEGTEQGTSNGAQVQQGEHVESRPCTALQSEAARHAPTSGTAADNTGVGPAAPQVASSETPAAATVGSGTAAAAAGGSDTAAAAHTSLPEEASGHWNNGLGHGKSSSTYVSAAGSEDASPDSSDSDADDSDAELDGGSSLLRRPPPMHSLAAALRAALSAKAGGTASSKQPMSQPDNKSDDRLAPTASVAVAAAAAGRAVDSARSSRQVHASGGSEEEEEDDADDVDLQWRPQLQQPAQRIARRPAQAQQEDIQAVGREPGLAKQLLAPPRDAAVAAKAARKAAPEAAGPKWYDLPAPQITDDMKRELRLLRLRGTYDPKRFYKSFDDSKFPKYFQIGTVVDSPLEWYGGRLANRQRKGTLTEELLADPESSAVRKRRYSRLQADAQKHVRVKKRKTDLPREKKKKARPRH